MRPLLVLIFSVLAAPTLAQSVEVFGNAGVLGEWELTGTVTPTGAAGAKVYTGALKVTHIGICTQDGPEVKSGELRYKLAGASRMNATLIIDGQECSYSGRLSDSWSGMMTCPGKRAVPLKLWLK